MPKNYFNDGQKTSLQYVFKKYSFFDFESLSSVSGIIPQLLNKPNQPENERNRNVSFYFVLNSRRHFRILTNLCLNLIKYDCGKQFFGA